MRILHLTTSYPRNSSDSAGSFVRHLVKALEKEGCQCGVLTPSCSETSSLQQEPGVHRFRYAPQELQKLAQFPGGIPHALAGNRFNYALIPGFLAAMASNLANLAKGYDLIHAHWSICGAIAVLTRQFHHTPVITTLRGTDAHRGSTSSAYGWLHRQAVMYSHFTVGVSSGIVWKLQEHFPHSKDRFVMIPNGVAEAFYDLSPRRDPAPPLKFLFLGSLIPSKGVDLLLKAFSACEKSKAWHLTIAGEGPEKDRLQWMARSMGMSDKVIFLGSVPPQAVPDLAANHHILVLPSQREGRPNAVLEAMAAGLPVLATDVDGTRELVQHDRTGWLVPYGNQDALVQAIDALLNRQKDLPKAGLNGRKWMMEQDLSWPQAARSYIGLYTEALDNG